MYEEFVDNICFNRYRYSAKLPWKEGQDILDSNYKLSLSCVKGQVKKLRKEPEFLQEYDSVIKEQLASGVIERVVELERPEGVYYIPHLAVICKEVSTTKLRVVYDRTITDNYRQISVLPTVSKVIERAAHMQFCTFLESHHLLVMNQFCFRRGRSTPLALTQFTDEMLANMDNSLLNGAIFLDLKKAFDTVDCNVVT